MFRLEPPYCEAYANAAFPFLFAAFILAIYFPVPADMRPTTLPSAVAVCMAVGAFLLILAAILHFRYAHRRISGEANRYIQRFCSEHPRARHAFRKWQATRPRSVIRWSDVSSLSRYVNESLQGP